MKSYPEYLAALRGGDLQQLSTRDARHLAGAMLDAGVPEVELGALITTMQLNPPCWALLLEGFVDALDERIHHSAVGADRFAPVSIGCYGGAWDAPNLTPLLGIVLARLGIPIVLHGPLHAHAGISSAILLRSLGIMPCAHHQQIAAALESRHIAFLPDALIAPGLALLIALRARLGPTALFTLAARLLNPFDGDALTMVWADDHWEFEALRGFMAAGGCCALLLGCSRADEKVQTVRRPRIEHWREGRCEILFEEEVMRANEAVRGPDPASVETTAMWMRQVCEGVLPLPPLLHSQFAACLYATGYCDDINQAKALAAIGATRERVA